MNFLFKQGDNVEIEIFRNKNSQKKTPSNNSILPADESDYLPRRLSYRNGNGNGGNNFISNPPTIIFDSFDYTGGSATPLLIGAVLRFVSNPDKPNRYPIERIIETSHFADFVQRESLYRYYWFNGSDWAEVPSFTGNESPGTTQVQVFDFPFGQNSHLYRFLEPSFDNYQFLATRFLPINYVDQINYAFTEASLFIPNTTLYVRAKDLYPISGWSTWANYSVTFVGQYQ